MNIIGVFIEVAILWLLITALTGAQDSAQSLRETWIVIIGMMFVNLLVSLFLKTLLGPLVAVIPVVALYFLIDKVLGESRKTTLRICGWYLAISFLWRLGFWILFWS